MFRFTLVTAALLLLTAVGFAQVPSGNVFVGYSYMSADLVPGDRTSLNGWNASVEGKVLPLLGLVADLSGHYGSEGAFSNACPPSFFGISCSVHEENFLFGPRLSFSVGKFRPFLHGLIGAGHISETATGFSNTDICFADALGGGIDYRVVPHVGVRLQIDALQTRFFSGSQNNVRVSTGIAFNF